MTSKIDNSLTDFPRSTGARFSPQHGGQVDVRFVYQPGFEVLRGDPRPAHRADIAVARRRVPRYSPRPGPGRRCSGKAQ